MMHGRFDKVEKKSMSPLPFSIAPKRPTNAGGALIAQIERNALFSAPHSLHPRHPTAERRKCVVNKSGHCACTTPPRRRPGAWTATKTLGTPVAAMCMGTVVVRMRMRVGVRRGAADGRFGGGFGLGRRWHDDFYFCSIGVEDVFR